MHRPALVTTTMILAGILLTGCGASADPSAPVENATTSDPTSADQNSGAAENAVGQDERSGSSVEVVAYPEGWPSDVPVPACDLVVARTYNSGFPASGGAAALEYACDDVEAEGAALLDVLRAQYTTTVDGGASGVFENDQWHFQVGYDDEKITYGLVAK